MITVVELLKSRGLLEAVTSETLSAKLQKGEKFAVYCGFDPTADSLHVGNLLALMGLKWFQKMGHTPFAIVGGATGRIGDPSGKLSERQLLDEKTLERNLAGIRKNIEQVLKPGPNEPHPVVLNNYDWMKGYSYLDFLRDIGKCFRMGSMLSKEAVKARVNSEEGMSYTEFSYQILQAYDFYYLNKEYGVTLQIGGSDQWGNITAGCELIRKLHEEEREVFGLTLPLLVKSDGQKFGKSESGAVWLSPEKLSPYDFYQYFIRVEDQDVIRLMKALTMMPLAEIGEIAESMSSAKYVPNSAQRRLAREITLLVHGEEGLAKAEALTQLARPGAETSLDVTTLQKLQGEIPTVSLKRENVVHRSLVDLIVEAKFMESKGEVRRLIKNGGLVLNNVRVCDEKKNIEEGDLIGTYLLLAFGKKQKGLIAVL